MIAYVQHKRRKRFCFVRLCSTSTGTVTLYLVRGRLILAQHCKEDSQQISVFHRVTLEATTTASIFHTHNGNSIEIMQFLDRESLYCTYRNFPFQFTRRLFRPHHFYFKVYSRSAAPFRPSGDQFFEGWRLVPGAAALLQNRARSLSRATSNPQHKSST